MWRVLASLVHFFYLIWEADERPEARRFTLGCAGIVFGAIGLISLYYYLR